MESPELVAEEAPRRPRRGSILSPPISHLRLGFLATVFLMSFALLVWRLWQV